MTQRDDNVQEEKISLKRIGQTIWMAVKDFFHDSGPQWAAAVAYYSLLSTVPLLLAIAALLFILARPLFVRYLNQFASYQDIYGSLAIVIILVFWAWIVAVIMLFGGEIASHSEEMLIEGNPATEVERRHIERAPTKKAQ